jgi:hypothetical protein
MIEGSTSSNAALVTSKSNELTTREDIKGKEGMFASFGSTVVIGPEFIDKVQVALGDGFGDRKRRTKEALRLIAIGEKDIGELDDLGAQTRNEGNVKDWGFKSALEASAHTQRFIAVRAVHESRRIGIPQPELWMKTIVVNERPYIVAAPAVEQRKGFMETLFPAKDEGGETDIPRYNRGVLAGLYPVGGIVTEEASSHARLGPFTFRLAAIAEETRKNISGDPMMDPNRLEIIVTHEKGYQEGRIRTIAYRKAPQKPTFP